MYHLTIFIDVIAGSGRQRESIGHSQTYNIRFGCFNAIRTNVHKLVGIIMFMGMQPFANCTSLPIRGHYCSRVSYWIVQFTAGLFVLFAFSSISRPHRFCLSLSLSYNRTTVQKDLYQRTNWIRNNQYIC